VIAVLVPLIIITVLVLLNGLFVAAEFAIIGVRPTRMTQLAEEGNRTALGVKRILEDPVQQDQYIATAQLGITIAGLGLGMYGEHTIAEWLLGPLEGWLHLDETSAHAVAVVAALALLTFAHVVVGEMVPKSLALQYAERTVLGIAGLMRLVGWLFYPAVRLLNAIGNGFLRLLRIPVAASHGRLYSPEELEMVVSESHEGGMLSDNQEQLLHNIFDFSERRVEQVMTPRRRIAAIPQLIGEVELQSYLATSPHSRFPVYDGDLDHVVGLLLLKDVVRQQIRRTEPFELRALLRHMPTVPETIPVEQLLASFKRSRVHMALVVDEYGGTVGLVTLEDLVEEVVGEVQDEFDSDELPPLREVAPGVLLVRGDVLLDELREQASIALPPDTALPDVETVGGLVVGLLGRPAHPDDRVRVDGTTITVEHVDGLAVQTVRITTEAESTRAGEQ
jgi:CBS domain containing-hemolysin-like protein